MHKILITRVNALSPVCKKANFKTRKAFANGIVMSKIVYFIQAWGGCSVYLISFLQIIQNRAGRLVKKLGWYTYMETDLKQCVSQLIVFHSLVLVFKLNKKPVYFNEIFKTNLKYKTRLAESHGINTSRYLTVQSTTSLQEKT